MTATFIQVFNQGAETDILELFWESSYPSIRQVYLLSSLFFYILWEKTKCIGSIWPNCTAHIFMELSRNTTLVEVSSAHGIVFCENAETLL